MHRKKRRTTGLAVGATLAVARNLPFCTPFPVFHPMKITHVIASQPAGWRGNPPLPLAALVFAKCKPEPGRRELWILTPACGLAQNDVRLFNKAQRGKHGTNRGADKIFRLASLAQDDNTGRGALFVAACRPQPSGASRTPPLTARPGVLRWSEQRAKHKAKDLSTRCARSR